jgi:hypothetical protein
MILISLVRNMLCSKLHCKNGFDLMAGKVLIYGASEEGCRLALRRALLGPSIHYLVLESQLPHKTVNLSL